MVINNLISEIVFIRHSANGGSVGKTLQQETPSAVDCTWQLVLSVAGVTLMRSNSVAVKALGASLTTLSLIRIIKKLATLA
jgi:hypothetical protein